MESIAGAHRTQPFSIPQPPDWGFLLLARRTEQVETLVGWNAPGVEYSESPCLLVAESAAHEPPQLRIRCD